MFRVKEHKHCEICKHVIGEKDVLSSSQCGPDRDIWYRMAARLRDQYSVNISGICADCARHSIEVAIEKEQKRVKRNAYALGFDKVVYEMEGRCGAHCPICDDYQALVNGECPMCKRKYEVRKVSMWLD